MKLKKHELEPFLSFLHEMNIPDRKASRMRSRFKRILADRIREVSEEKQEIIDKYAEKDELGNPVIKNEKTKEIKFKDNDAEINANQEYIDILNEDCVIEENEERKDILLSIKDSILNYDDEEYFKNFKGQKADEYDRWCEIVEQIDYEK